MLCHGAASGVLALVVTLLHNRMCCFIMDISNNIKSVNDTLMFSLLLMVLAQHCGGLSPISSLGPLYNLKIRNTVDTTNFGNFILHLHSPKNNLKFILIFLYMLH